MQQIVANAAPRFMHLQHFTTPNSVTPLRSPSIKAFVFLAAVLLFISMNVAVCTFKNNVSPRLDVSDTLFVYTIDNNTITNVEKHSPSCDQPVQLISFLQEKNIDTIIMGGCPRFYLRMLLIHRMNVIYGISGEPDAVAQMICDDQLEISPIPPCMYDFHQGQGGGNTHEKRNQCRRRKGNQGNSEIRENKL